MTDLLRFEEFFKSMGVEHEIATRMESFAHPQYGVSCILVSQAIFWFDVDGKYVGVEDDEMGHFRPRI